VIACHRISHDQWKNKKALGEAKTIGLDWEEAGTKNYVSSFQVVVTPSRLWRPWRPPIRTEYRSPFHSPIHQAERMIAFAHTE